MDTDTFVLSVNTKNNIKDFYSLEDSFDFSNLSESLELFSNRNKKVIGKFKTQTPKNDYVDKFVCQRSKMFAIKCADDSKNKLKGI